MSAFLKKIVAEAAAEPVVGEATARDVLALVSAGADAWKGNERPLELPRHLDDDTAAAVLRTLPKARLREIVEQFCLKVPVPAPARRRMEEELGRFAAFEPQKDFAFAKGDVAVAEISQGWGSRRKAVVEVVEGLADRQAAAIAVGSAVAHVVRLHPLNAPRGCSPDGTMHTVAEKDIRPFPESAVFLKAAEAARRLDGWAGRDRWDAIPDWERREKFRICRDAIRGNFMQPSAVAVPDRGHFLPGDLVVSGNAIVLLVRAEAVAEPKPSLSWSGIRLADLKADESDRGHVFGAVAGIAKISPERHALPAEAALFAARLYAFL